MIISEKREPIPQKTILQVRAWLLDHEESIADSENDFGELVGLFEFFLRRKPDGIGEKPKG
ncbi:MAG: hypothetical protein KAV87_49895 [Desulfobacteraceae bacterium]|nr:hypothetical protein [Desulfobacteraceae bacterium]